jgi:MOSC domain-containing protein YiiM
MSASTNQGTVASIYVASLGSAPMQARQAVRAVAGGGLEGDRYCEGTGYYSGDPVWDADVTFIEFEAIEGVRQRFGLALDSGAPRRNIVTRGVALAELVGKRFRVGGALLQGLKPWPPCSHLAQLVGSRDILPGLAHCGGIGAEVLSDGQIQVGDAIELVDALIQ